MSATAPQVRRHTSDAGWWEMVDRPAPAWLSPHVLGYCGYAEETVAFHRRRELPSGEVIVIIGFGPRLETTYPDGRAARLRSFAAGLHETHCFVASPGAQAGIQVNLTPIGAHLLFGVPMHELSSRVVALDELLGAETHLLAEALYEAGEWSARFELLDAFLERRLRSARPASPDVAWAWRRIVESAGELSVSELCAELRCSRRHLLRRFHEQIGLAPKAFARILRFQRAVRVLGHADGPSTLDGSGPGAGPMTWGEVAAQCGYFDQAHMNRDFRSFAGATPTEIAASMLPDAGGLAG